MGGDRRKLFVALFGLAAVGLFLAARPSRGGDAEPERRETSFIRVGRHYLNVERILYAAREDGGLIVVFGPGGGDRFKLDGADAAAMLRWLDELSVAYLPLSRVQRRAGPPMDGQGPLAPHPDEPQQVADPLPKSFVRAGRYYINAERILHAAEEGGELVVVFGPDEGGRLKLKGPEVAIMVQWLDEWLVPFPPPSHVQRRAGPPIANP